MVAFVQAPRGTSELLYENVLVSRNLALASEAQAIAHS
jgi:hypothetical protein